MQALRLPDVSVHFILVIKVELDGLIGVGRASANVDTLIYAIGFDTSYNLLLSLPAKEGFSIQEKFTPNPDGYFGFPGKNSPQSLPAIIINYYFQPWYSQLSYEFRAGLS
jgi:hypothetical protein